MSYSERVRKALLLFIYFLPIILYAQDKRAQYPAILKNSFFGVNIGSINYPFSSKQLKPGNTVGSVRVPHTAVRIILFGHQFNRFLSGQISYMRPVGWVEYNNMNNDHLTHTVWMNIAGMTLTGNLPITQKLNLNLEGGLGLIMRNGFSINDVQVVPQATYSTGEFGASLRYTAGKKWDLHAGLVWSPANERLQQPVTSFYSAGINYYMRPLPPQKVEKTLAAGYHFPRQIIYAGFATNGLGYGVNRFVSEGKIPVFWGGEVKMKTGFTFNYQRNIFHARKVFALDWGAGVGIWTSRINHSHFFTLSAYPVFRFTAIRSKTADFYAEWSVAGPTYISKVIVDGEPTGKHFTFQDVMGIGMFAGKKKTLNAGIRIAHYSNGNLFPRNGGFMVPLTCTLGYAFP